VSDDPHKPDAQYLTLLERLYKIAKHLSVVCEDEFGDIFTVAVPRTEMRELRESVRSLNTHVQGIVAPTLPPVQPTSKTRLLFYSVLNTGNPHDDHEFEVSEDDYAQARVDRTFALELAAKDYFNRMLDVDDLLEKRTDSVELIVDVAGTPGTIFAGKVTIATAAQIAVVPSIHSEVDDG
jgi:hypothetical protein